MASFTQNITTFFQKTGIKLDLIVKKLAFDGFKGVLFRSPVDTGRFRGSWRIGIGRINLSVLKDLTGPKASNFIGPVPAGAASPPAPHSPPTSAELAFASSKLSSVKFGTKVVISNNLPYAIPLENGHSKQAPAGVLIITFLEIKSNFAATVASVK